MKRELKILGAIGAVVVIAAALATLAYKGSAPPPPAEPSASTREELIREDSPTLGPANAPATIVEFLDPECESCKAYYPVMKAALAKYHGKVRFVVRYMTFHRSSQMAVAATEAAGRQGQYWEMQELLFAEAGEWGHQPEPRRDLFVKYANLLGLDLARFQMDLDDLQWSAKTRRDMADGQALGVKGTPTIFVNGQILPDLSADTLDASIQKALGPL